LLKASVFESISKATVDCGYVIATSARKGRERRALKPEEIVKRFGKGAAKIAIVFGCEADGLSNEEIAECDFVARIAASRDYPTLNLSHAVVAILCQVFKAESGKSVFDARPETRKRMLEFFKQDLELVPGIDNRPRVLAAFKAMSSRSLLSEKEARALLAFFGKTKRALKGKAGKQ